MLVGTWGDNSFSGAPGGIREAEHEARLLRGEAALCVSALVCERARVTIARCVTRLT